MVPDRNHPLRHVHKKTGGSRSSHCATKPQRREVRNMSRSVTNRHPIHCPPPKRWLRALLRTHRTSCIGPGYACCPRFPRRATRERMCSTETLPVKNPDGEIPPLSACPIQRRALMQLNHVNRPQVGSHGQRGAEAYSMREECKSLQTTGNSRVCSRWSFAFPFAAGAVRNALSI